MSFSGEVKEELVKLENDARHCQIAELAVILVYAGAIKTDASGEVSIELQSDAPCLWGQTAAVCPCQKMTAVSSKRRLRQSNTRRATGLSIRL